jgi:ribosomal-protein-alanine N-acetyltransferase
MPFTPFHMGAGLAVKGVAGHRFSVLMFGLAQVAMDIQPGIGLILGSEVLHGWTHTYAGATLIALIVLALGRPLALLILRRWNRELVGHRLAWLVSPEQLDWKAAAAGAFVGTYSHVALDSLMHADMHPWAPYSQANAMLQAISYESLILGCVVAGVAGIALWFASNVRRKRHPLPRRAGDVVLRRLAPSDLAAFQGYRHDAEVARYQGWTAKSDAEAAAFLAEMSDAPLFKPGKWSQIGIADGGLIGDVGLFLAEDGREAEVGFTMRRESQGRGFAAAAVRESIALVFEQTGVERVLGITDARNLASVRLLQRVGMTMIESRDANSGGEPCVEQVFAIARQPARKKSP